MSPASEPRTLTSEHTLYSTNFVTPFPVSGVKCILLEGWWGWGRPHWGASQCQDRGMGTGAGYGEAQALMWVERKKEEGSIWVSVLWKRHKSRRKHHSEGRIQRPVVESQHGSRPRFWGQMTREKKQGINEMCLGKLVSTALEDPMTHSCGGPGQGVTLCWLKSNVHA